MEIGESFTTETKLCYCGKSTNKHFSCEHCETRAGESNGKTEIITYTMTKDGLKEESEIVRR